MKGTVFWANLDNEPHSHLRFVISNPAENGLCLAVHCCTKTGGRFDDLTCILNEGDHRGIKHPSFIRYSNPIEISPEQIQQKNRDRQLFLVEPMNNTTLLQIQTGAKNSDDLPEKFEIYFEYF